jgi:predicted PurR-regulated permease PerM
MIFAFIIGAVLGLLNPSPETAVLKIMLVIGVIQILDTAIISPKVVGEKLGLHPVLMIFSLFVFAKIWGMIGLLISIPLTAILKVFIMEWYEQDFMKKELFGDETGKAKD